MKSRNAVVGAIRTAGWVNFFFFLPVVKRGATPRFAFPWVGPQRSTYFVTPSVAKKTVHGCEKGPEEDTVEEISVKELEAE